MFQELIAQGMDMIRRLEAERRLPPPDREALPRELRVPTGEVVDWHDAVERRLRKAWDVDTLARYERVSALYRDELARGEGDEYLRNLNAWRRIVALLSELDERPPSRSVAAQDPRDARR